MASVQRLDSWAEHYFGEGLFEAAVDAWMDVAECPDAPIALKVRAYDGLGKVAAQRGRPDHAVEWFDRSLALIPEDDQETMASIAMRRVIALGMLGRPDQAFREAQSLLDRAQDLSLWRQGILLTNLAGLEMANALYRPAIQSLQRARGLLGAESRFEYQIDVNMGTSYFELHDLGQAREWFEHALAARNTASKISAVNGLAHVALLEGHHEAMQRWSQKAFDGMWDGLMSFEPEEMAHLADVLGQMSLQSGHGRLAVRLFDHAQNLYGRVGQWHRFRGVNVAIAQAEELADMQPNTAHTEELTRFIVLLENMAAQDLLEARASQIADIRLVVARRIAGRLGCWHDQQQPLSYVCRLADVGLTVVGDGGEGAGGLDGNSPLYEMHPAMSVRLLDRLGLPESVLAGIQDHHERWDGTGFPDGKSHEEIALLGQIFAVADFYARQTAGAERRHREVLDDLGSEVGGSLSPDCAEALFELFEGGVSG